MTAIEFTNATKCMTTLRQGTRRWHTKECSMARGARSSSKESAKILKSITFSSKCKSMMDLNSIETGSVWLIKLDLITETSLVMLRVANLVHRVTRILDTKTMLVEGIIFLVK